MILKLQYNNLPYSLQQKISYEQIKKYVFFGSELEKKIQKIIKNKLIGHSSLVHIKESRKMAIKYGCTNEAELLECAKIITNTERQFTVINKSNFENLNWQRHQFN